VILLSSCKGTVTPIEEPEPEPGNRNYTWYLGALDMPMNCVSFTWGATPDDVWAGGAGGTEYDRLWHYDGTTWAAYSEAIWCTGHTMYGFGNDDVWLGGSGGWFSRGAGIWHYDGIAWKENYVFSVDNAYDVAVNNIWGCSRKDIYACGIIVYKDDVKEDFRGFILHYNGKTWQEIYRADFQSEFIKIRGFENALYLMSYDVKQNVLTVYRLKGKNLEEVSPDGISMSGSYDFYLINRKMYFRKGHNVYLYANGAFEQKFSVPADNFDYILGGRNEKDIFLSMGDGIAHYNGEDIQYLLKFEGPNWTYLGTYEGLFFENEVFGPFLDRTDGVRQNKVLHGILNE